MYRWLSFISVVITLPLISFGAIVRLKGAGLACPDWPLCYGQIIPPPGFGIALEVGHRFVATLLGILIIWMVILTFTNLSVRSLRILSVSALLLVIFQGILGGLTVLMKLDPYIVTLHLLGGNLLLLLLVYSTFKAFLLNHRVFRSFGPRFSRIPSIGKVIFLIFLFFVMLFSGGLNSSHYAGTSCDGFPLCKSEQPFSIGWTKSEGFKLSQYDHLAEVSKDHIIPTDKKERIHMFHRVVVILGSLILIFWGAFPWIRARKPQTIVIGFSLIFCIVAEIFIGIINALWAVPFPISALHTFIASLITVLLGWGLYVSVSQR